MRTKEYSISQLIDECKVENIHQSKIAYRVEKADDILLDWDICGVDCYMFLMIKEGEVDVNINNSAQMLSAGTVLLIKPYARLFQFQPSPDYEAKIILIDKIYFDQTAESNRFHALQNRVIAASGMAALVLESREIREIEHAWDMLYSMTTTMQRYISEGYEYLVNYIQLQLADVMFRSAAQRQQKIVHKDKLFQDFLKLLSAHYEQEHNILYYAKQLGVSPAYLSRIVREVSGKTVHTYISERLYTAARHLLGTTDSTVSEIAYRLHFSDQSAFGKFFKSHAGISPLQYKNSLK